MTDNHHGPDLQQVHMDYLLDPDDLKEIMEDLKGEELSLEELALTLLAGGIELEYLSEKYSTNKGPKNLLLVIACQDSLEVDWDDLRRRCDQVIACVVGNHLRQHDAGEEHLPGDEDLFDLVEEGLKIEYEETSLDPMQWAMFHGHLQSAKRNLSSAKRVDLLSGGVAPQWTGPQLGPAIRQEPGIPPGPDLGARPGLEHEGKLRLQKSAGELLGVRVKPVHEVPKLVPIEKFIGIVREDPQKWRPPTQWSQDTLDYIICADSQSGAGSPPLEEEGPG